MNKTVINKGRYTIPDNLEVVVKGNDLIVQRKESKDEKIRKEIVEFLTYGIWNATTIDKVKQSQRYAKWISYLEKQKEDYSSFPEEERKYMEKYIPLDRTTLIKLLAERDRETEEILKSFEGLEEEKPAEWSEEDEKQLNWVIEHFSQSGELYHDLITWFKSLPERFNLQPKQEWSEKDEKMRKSIINILGDNTDAHEEGWAIFANEIAWLKSLRFQPEQEWSEEDKKALERAINCVRTWEVDYCDGDNRISERLKSFHPSWKPTGKQIEALVRVVSYRKMSWGDRLILLGLVKDFKEFYNL